MNRLTSQAASEKIVAGFALLEVLIALAIVAIALPALMFRMQSIANTTGFIETRTVAYWVAENRMQELIADQLLLGDTVRTRRQQGEVEYDSHTWFWRAEVEELELGELLAPEKMYRLVVDVGLEEDEILASITGYLGD